MNDIKCLLVKMTGKRPFNRCKFCERQIQECFGIQFFIIAAAIIGLLITTFFISDLPALVLDIMIVITLLIMLLSYLADKETNEIVLNNVILSQMNKELEDKVKQRTTELQGSNDELTKINRTMNDFVGIINHELKTPITAVISGIEVIKSRGIDKLDESQKNLIGVMEKSGWDMLKLTNNLLDLSKIEAGKIVIYSECLVFSKLLEEVVQSLKPEAEKRKVNLNVNIDRSITTIFGDSVRLKQVFFNIIDNAIKYSKENGNVDIKVTDSDKHIILEVKDSGIGISKENMGSIFDKFTRRVAGIKGTGLGLYITRSFVEAHKGNIEVDSEYGKGTTFKITLPKVQVV